ncbi:pyruvate ferredoxin oxidoreductase [Thermosulfuriphilus ammonigenes]|uniref:Pyruvate ferredoxin oxidoreductase n=1 Tax=Thermosulfuriphilus ammonigenes TaxID=1936021 RepID=A0A6G7PXK8_9BACT|nr:pyruvate ferredoxin oxidoreductase [Thermosulfuriphilus ammonigenes]MBA2849612.1 pyruvate ferredoxin oxidoreductase alpha subunit [Thermosulfuriphilus ammonigenes]QIJ72286.1 pyruvate ferredoxin oxidoreductase [Thermosulfuriphilus ammonigenes]
MSKRVAMEVSIAIAEAVKMANVDVISAYPITPQTHIVEHLSEVVANGELDAEYITVESEHSAMSACLGAAATGARVFTSTSSQGLALMHEILFIAPPLRLPVVMVVANRALSAPISIWNDHGDIMAQRDIGWLMTFAENGQEAFDLTLHAFRVAEDRRVMLPFAVNIDGFNLSHVIEPIEIPDQELVDRYIPKYKPKFRLEPRKPISIGAVGIPEVYTEAKKVTDEAVKNARKVILKAWDEFADIFGRRYQPVETYRAEDAEILILIMGSLAETAMTAVDKMREAGKKVGLVRLRLWRPFPLMEFRKAISGAKILAVVDRALSPGAVTPPVASEVRSALYSAPKRPKIFSFIAGLGGRDVTTETFEEIVDKAAFYAKKRPKELYEMIGVREI